MLREWVSERGTLLGAVAAVLVAGLFVFLIAGGGEDNGDAADSVAVGGQPGDLGPDGEDDAEGGSGGGRDGGDGGGSANDQGGQGGGGGSGGGAGGGGGDDRTGPPIVQDDPGGGDGGRDGPVGPAEDVDAVTSRLTAYLTAIHRGDGRAACAQLSARGRRNIERKIAKIAPETGGAECERAILLYQGAYGSAIRRPAISRIRVSGSRATAIGPYREPAKLSNGSRGWLIDDYGR